MKIGVFDSGIGGLSVVNAIKKSLPNIEVVFVNDPENVPYGLRVPNELIDLVKPKIDLLIKASCSVIVIACNTVTTTIISDLRQYSSVPLIGMEPMVKPAISISKTHIIAVCATPTTLASKRYQWLKSTYGVNATILEPDCSDWSAMVESNTVDRQKIYYEINQVCKEGADVVVLGCTHYHWIEDIISDITKGRAIVIQPERPVIKELKRVLELRA